MKIIFLVPSVTSGNGGIQTYTNFVIRALKEQDVELLVISLLDYKKAGNLGYQFFPCARTGLFKKPFFFIQAIVQVIKFKPDLVLSAHLHFSSVCYFINKIFKVPYFVFAHGIEAWGLRFLEAIFIRRSSRVLAVSRFTKDSLLRQMPHYNSNSVQILPNTFDSSRFEPRDKPDYLMKRLGINSSDKVIFTVCRLAKLERYKGYDHVIKALKKVVSQIPETKYILGGSGDDRERINALIKECHLENRIILSGFIPEDELADYYNLCDIFVMPSQKEGFGIVFLEALSCGRPVIAGNQDGSVDALLDGELGLLVNPLDEEEISKALIKMLKKEVAPRLLDKEYLRKRVSEEYGFDKFKQKLAVQLVGI